MIQSFTIGTWIILWVNTVITQNVINAMQIQLFTHELLHVENRPRDLPVLTLPLEKLHTTITNSYENGNVLYIIAPNLFKRGRQETNNNLK